MIGTSAQRLIAVHVPQLQQVTAWLLGLHRVRERNQLLHFLTYDKVYVVCENVLKGTLKRKANVLIVCCVVL